MVRACTSVLNRDLNMIAQLSDICYGTIEPCGFTSITQVSFDGVNRTAWGRIR